MSWMLLSPSHLPGLLSRFSSERAATPCSCSETYVGDLRYFAALCALQTHMSDSYLQFIVAHCTPADQGSQQHFYFSPDLHETPPPSPLPPPTCSCQTCDRKIASRKLMTDLRQTMYA